MQQFCIVTTCMQFFAWQPLSTSALFFVARPLCVKGIAMHVVGPVVGLSTALCLYSRVRVCCLSARRQMNPVFFFVERAHTGHFGWERAEKNKKKAALPNRHSTAITQNCQNFDNFPSRYTPFYTQTAS